MRITECIKALDNILAKEGDIRVVYFDYEAADNWCLDSEEACADVVPTAEYIIDEDGEKLEKVVFMN